MEPKTVIITGANSGIGKAAAKQIAAQGHRVVLACRNMERAKAAQREIGGYSLTAQLDLAQRASIHAFTDWVHRELGKADAVISNAADFDLSQKQRVFTPDGFERIWFTNHLGPVLLIDRLMDLLIASPQGRILTVSSKGLLMHPFLTVNLNDPMFNDRPYSVPKAYYQSKLAQSMFTNWLAKQLTGTMVTANCIRVTNVKLDLNRFPDIPQWMKNLYAIKALFAIPPEKMAATYARAALDPALKNENGRLIEYPLKTCDFPPYEKDPLCIEQVMRLTYRQLGINPAITYETGSN